MTGVIAVIPKYQFSSATGAPLVNGTLTTYLAGTTTLTSTWQDQALTALNTNPIALDARGECVLWLDSTKNYKFVLKNWAGVTQWTQDNLSGAGSGSALAAPTGASMIGFIQAGLGAAARTAQDKLREQASLLDYIPIAQHAGLLARTSTYDCLAGFNASMAAHSRVYVPGGYRFPVSGTVRIPANTTLCGDGATSEIFGMGVTGDLLTFGPDGVNTYFARAEGITLSGTAATAFSSNYAVHCSAERVYTDGVFTDGFKFYYTYPGTFSTLVTGGHIVNACFTFLDEVNACVFSNLYTSTFAQYNFLYNGTGHSNTFINPTAQGGRYGFYVKSTGYFGAIAISGLYTENVAKPLVLGASDLSGSAFGVTVQGATLAGPELTHPYYAECIAAIELNFVSGATFSGIDFLGTLRTAGGFPTVTITGNGAGALAMARVKPTGEIHSIEVLTTGTGYTNATAVITGGGGVGATLALILAAGKVSTISVTAAGAGYKRLQTPMAIRFHLATNVKFTGCRAGTECLGVNSPLYPLMVYMTGSAQFYHSTISIDDVSIRNYSVGGSASVMKLVEASEKFAVIEYDGAGAQSVYVYKAPAYP